MNIFGDLKAIGAATAAVIVTIAVYSLLNTAVLLPKAREEGKAAYIAERAVAARKAQMERNGDDAKLQRMSDFDLCVSALGGVPECDTFRLRPVPEK